MARPQRLLFELDGDLSTTPLAHLLIAAERERFTGTLVLGPPARSFFDRSEKRVRLEDGVAVAADLGDLGEPEVGSSLVTALIHLCGQESGHFQCLSDRDMVGRGRLVLRGHVDPWTLLAASLRNGSVREDAVSRALEAVASGQLQMRRGCAFERLSLMRDEWNFVQKVRRRGGSLEDLLHESDLPEGHARHLLYLLLMTGMLVRLPSGRNVESRTLSIQPSPTGVTAGDDTEADDYPEERTIVCELSALNLEMPAGDESLEESADAPKPISMYPGMDQDGSAFEGSRLFRLGQLSLSRGQLDDALSRVEQALTHSPADPRFLAFKARVLQERAGDPASSPEEALSLARDALALDQDCELAHEVLGRSFKAAGKMEQAQRHFRAAALRNPANLYVVQEILAFDPSSSPDRPSFWQRLRRSIPPFKSVG